MPQESNECWRNNLHFSEGIQIASVCYPAFVSVESNICVVFYLCPIISLIREIIKHEGDTNLMFLSLFSLIAANEDFFAS